MFIHLSENVITMTNADGGVSLNTEMSEDLTLFVACCVCHRSIAFLAMRKNQNTNWSGHLHVSNGRTVITICKRCSDMDGVENMPMIARGYMTKGEFAITRMSWATKKCVTGTVTVPKTRKRIMIMNRFDAFTMVPSVYTLAFVTGVTSWPTERSVPSSFF